jgi:hypothetical protein
MKGKILDYRTKDEKTRGYEISLKAGEMQEEKRGKEGRMSEENKFNRRREERRSGRKMEEGRKEGRKKRNKTGHKYFSLNSSNFHRFRRKMASQRKMVRC